MKQREELTTAPPPAQIINQLKPYTAQLVNRAIRRFQVKASVTNACRFGHATGTDSIQIGFR